jgi:hypothetical protein
MIGVKRFRLLICVLTFLIPVSGVTADPDAAVVQVEGEALVTNGNLPEARERALQEAYSAALTKVLGSYISAESYTRNFESIDRGVYSRTRGYIKRYEVLKETTTEGILQLQVRVEVSTAPLKDDLTALGILQDAIGNPLLLVQGEEQSLAPPVSVRKFREDLAQRGFRLAQGETDPADVLIRLRGSLQSSSEIGGVGMYGAIVSLEAAASWRKSGQSILTAAETANGAGINLQSALADGYTKAAQRLFPLFLERLVSSWQAELSTGRLVPIEVRVASLADLTRFKQRLGKIFGIDKVELKQFQPGLGELLVRFRGSAPQLAELIEKTTFPGQTVSVESLNQAGLVISAHTISPAGHDYPVPSPGVRGPGG